MADDTKVVYLRKENGKSIKTYVVDYLFDIESRKTYVIIVDQNGKNAKGFQILDEEAIILSTKESSLFKNYQNNPKFQIVTDQYIDGMSFDLVKEHQELNIGELSKNAEAIVYYVYDEGKLSSYKADLANTQKGERILFHICFLKSFDHVEKENVKEIAKDGHHEEPIYLVYNKQTDLNFRKNGTILLLNFEKIEENEFEQGTIQSEVLKQKEDEKNQIQEPEVFDFSEPVLEKNENDIEKQIVFYLYDQDVVKKYKGLLVDEEANKINVHFVESMGMIQNIGHLSFEEFLNHKDIEVGSYFARYDDYISSIENHDGIPYVVATIYNCLQKSTSKENIEEIMKEVPPKEIENLNEEKAIVFRGSIDVLDEKEHYTLWGCICTIKAQEPLTLIPEKNGVETIIFEDQNNEAKSIHDLCQIYQNLYPNLPVYLLEKEQIRNGKEHIFKENDYIRFMPQEKNKTASLLDVGKKVLTVDEMIEKRNEDLKNLKKKN